jgi:transcription elongation factor GreA
MLSNVIYVTEEGLQRIKKELDSLLNGRPTEFTQHHYELSEHLDGWECNNDFIAWDERSFVEDRIRELEHKLAHAKVVECDHSNGIVQIGSTVIVQENGQSSETYKVVGTLEANSMEGLISNESPLGQALLHHKAGDEVVVNAPVGVEKFLILKVT